MKVKQKEKERTQEFMGYFISAFHFINDWKEKRNMGELRGKPRG